MRLFSTEKVFQKYHLAALLKPERLEETALVWAPPRDSYRQQATLRFGTLCCACSRRRQGDIFGGKVRDEMPSLHCSLCKRAHKAMHFSMAARREQDDSERTCLGHELSLRICSHKVVHFQEIKLLARNGGSVLSHCAEPHRGRHDCNTRQCADGITKIWSYKGKDSGGLLLALSFSTHLKLSRLPSGKFCPRSIRSELAVMGSIPGAGSWTDCKKFAYADPMRAFDPNICDCFEWLPASYRGHMRWQLCPDHPDYFKAPREPAIKDGYTSKMGRCASFRHGFDVLYNDLLVKIDFMKCPRYDDRLVLRQQVICRIEPSYACGPGWGHLVTHLSHNPSGDTLINGAAFCSIPGCALRKLADNNAFGPGYWWG